jgi:hypothetical protein
VLPLVIEILRIMRRKGEGIGVSNVATRQIILTFYRYCAWYPRGKCQGKLKMSENNLALPLLISSRRVREDFTMLSVSGANIDFETYRNPIQLSAG